ncbi:MAG: hypothetical protein SGI89_11760 [bacterium]|nr:hypothetical protein [bacterium]
MINKLIFNGKYSLLFFSIFIFLIFTIFIAVSGYFQIGLLSDDYLNFISAQSSTLLQKFTSSVPYYNSLHLRPLWFISINLSIAVNNLFDSAKDNFIFFRIENLIYFYVLIFLAANLFYKITKRLYFSVALILICLLYPNNLNDICWTAGKVDLLCGVFIFAALNFVFSYTESSTDIKMYFTGFFFLLALLTKETSVILPFITIMLVLLVYNKEKVFEMKKLIGFQFLVLIIYFSYRVFLLGLKPKEVATAFQSPGLLSSLSVSFKAFLSIIVPYDYLSIQNNVYEQNTLFLIYFFVILIVMISVLFILIRKGKYGYLGILTLIFLISIAPNIIAGYFRPQLALIPFIIFFFSLLIVFTKLDINLRYFQIILILVLLLFSKLSNSLILEWKYAYDVSVTSIKSLIDVNIDTQRRNIVIGLPSRFKQAHMLDYATGAYNYWKYGEFVLKDRIIDIVLVGGLDINSLNSEIVINELSPTEFELQTTGETGYFIQLDAFRSKYKDRDIELRLSEMNLFRKPTYLGMRILSDKVDIYITTKDGFRKLKK